MNRLQGRLEHIDTDGSIALLEVSIGGHALAATLIGYPQELLGWPMGKPLTLIFKESEVSLGKGLSGGLSIRNRLPCRIAALECGRLLARVGLDFEGHPIEAIITTRSAQRLQLAIGDTVDALIKTNEMTLSFEAES